MGSWNATCAISNLPIQAGEDVVAFIIHSQSHRDKNGGTSCYATDLYRPITLPIYSSYNEYGGINSVHSSMHTEILDQINSVVDITHLIEKEFSNVSPEHLDTADVINDIISRGEVPELGLVMIRLDIFNALTNALSSESDKYRDGAKDYLLHFDRKFQEAKSAHPDSQQLYLDNLFSSSSFAFVLSNVYENDFTHALIYNRIPQHLMTIATKLYLFDTMEERDYHLDLLIDLLLAHNIMSELRKSWSPQSGSGSQSLEVELHRVLALEVYDATLMMDDNLLLNHWSDSSKEFTESVKNNVAAERKRVEDRIGLIFENIEETNDIYTSQDD